MGSKGTDKELIISIGYDYRHDVGIIESASWIKSPVTSMKASSVSSTVKASSVSSFMTSMTARPNFFFIFALNVRHSVSPASVSNVGICHSESI